MVTTLNQTLNTFSSTTYPGEGAIPDGVAMDLITQVLDAYDTREQPFTTRATKGKALNQPTYRSLKKYIPERTSAVAAGSTGTIVASGSGTKLTVASGEGIRFQTYELLDIIDVTAGTFHERMLVLDRTGDVLTVQRGIDGGTPSSTIAATDLVQSRGTAEPEGKPHVISPTSYGTSQTYSWQTFVGGVKATWMAQNTPTYEEANKFLAAVKDLNVRLRDDLEFAAIHGHVSYGDPDASAPVPRQMAGILDQILTNRVSLSSAALTKRSIEDVFSTIWETVGVEPGTTIVTSFADKRIINTMLNPIRRTTLETTKAGTQIEEVMTAAGTYRFEVMRTWPKGTIGFINFKDVILHNYQGLDWHVTEKPGKVHGTDVDEKFLSATYSLEVVNEERMALLTGFDQVLDNYPDDTDGITVVSA